MEYKVWIQPIHNLNETEAYIVKFKIDNQLFTIDGYWQKKEAEWMADMLRKALSKLKNSHVIGNDNRPPMVLG